MKRKSLFRIATGLIAVALLATGCSSSTESDGSTGPKLTDTYKWALSIAITSMDPHTTANVYDYMYLWPVYDRLTQLNNDTAAPEAMLATDWKVATDGQSLTMTLRKGVKFHDGTDFNADVAKQNIDRMVGSPASTIKGQLINVDSVSVVDEYTIKVNMKGATAGPMPAIFGGFGGTMVSPKSFDDSRLKAIGVGAGPYKVVSNEAGTVTYEAFADYWDKSVQKVKKIVTAPISDDQTRLNAVISGTQNGVLIRGGQIETAKKAGLTVVEGISPTLSGIEINMNRAKFGDVRVRQAINYAIDREAISKAAFGGTCQTNSQVFAKGYYAHNDSLDNAYPHDVAKAKALMAEAGLAGGFEFELSSPNIPTWVTLVTAVQAQLAEIGIKVKLNVVAGSAANTAYWVEQRTDALTSSDPFVIDASQVVQQYFGAKGLRNVANLNDPRINELAAKGLAGATQAERAAAYQALQKIVSDDALNPIAVCNQKTAWAFTTNTSGFVIGKAGFWDYRNIKVTQK